MWVYSYGFNSDRHSQVQKADEVYIFLGIYDKWIAEVIWIISIYRINNRLTSHPNRIFLSGPGEIRFLRSLQRRPNLGIWCGKCP